MNIALCIKRIYPAASNSDYSVFGEGENGDENQHITKWNLPSAKPTSEQLASAWDEIVSEQADKASAEKLLSELFAAYANFSDGGKWAFGSAYDTVVNHIRRGDIAAAKLTVQMIAIPAEVPETSPEELETWTTKKSEILALFP